MKFYTLVEYSYLHEVPNFIQSFLTFTKLCHKRDHVVNLFSHLFYILLEKTKTAISPQQYDWSPQIWHDDSERVSQVHPPSKCNFKNSRWRTLADTLEWKTRFASWSRFVHFKMAAVRHFGFLILKYRNFRVYLVKYKNSLDDLAQYGITLLSKLEIIEWNLVIFVYTNIGPYARRIKFYFKILSRWGNIARKP